MHHAGKTYGTYFLQLNIVLIVYVLFQGCVAILQAFPYLVLVIGPNPIFQMIFPLMVTLSQDLIVLIYKNSLDSGRAKFNTKGCGLSLSNNLI